MLYAKPTVGRKSVIGMMGAGTKPVVCPDGEHSHDGAPCVDDHT
jgi:hypothetical protein